jgi:hypothetical protein
MRKWELFEFGGRNGWNAEVGMRKWELFECGSWNAELGKIGQRARDDEFGGRNAEVGII